MVLYTGPGSASNPIIFGISVVAQILGSLFGISFGGGSVNDLARQVSIMRDQLNKSIDDSVRFTWKTLTALGALLHAVEQMWVFVIHEILNKLKDLVVRIASILGKILVPMVNAIQKIRQILKDVYDHWLRPILNIIQKVRKYLQILKLLHVPFAAKLDGILARIQGKIIGPYLYLLRLFNGFGNWINFILTAGGVLQRGLFINTMYRYQRDWVNMLGNSVSRTARGGSLPPANPWPDTMELPAIKAAMSDSAKTDGGVYADTDALGVAAFQQEN